MPEEIDPIPIEGEDDLLANAIPIDQIEDEPDEPQPQPATVAPPPKKPSRPTATSEPPPEAIELVDGDGDERLEIRATGSNKQRHEYHFKRKTHHNGTGATRVKTFVSKLRLDAIEHMEELVNEWLDEHPEFEVKFVTTSIGELTGKLKEPAMFMTVWY